MTLRLFRSYLAEPRLIMLSLMLSTIFAFSGDPGIVLVFASTIASARIFPNRASLFEAALPISARTILRARMLAAYAFALVPLVVWLVAMQTSTMAQMSRDLMPEFSGMRPITSIDRISLCAIVLTAATIPFALRANEMKRPPALLLVGAQLGLLVLSALVFFALPMQPALVVFILTAIGVHVWTTRSAPASFQIASLQLEDGSSESSGPSGMHPGAGKYWGVAIARTVMSPPWMFFAVLLTLQSALGNWIGSVAIQFAFIPVWRQKSAWLAAFPLSRRARLMVTLVPVVIGTFGAIVLGSFVPIPGLLPSHMNPITWQSVSFALEPGPWYDSPTRIKLMFWDVAPNGHPPLIVAPFGESITPDTLRVPGALMYNPYTTKRNSSKQFTEWQYARASTEVYGYPVPMPQSWEESLVFPPPLYDALRVRILNTSALLCFVLLMYLLADVGRFRAPAGRGLLQKSGELLGAAPGFIFILIDGYYGTRHTTQIMVPLARRLLWHLSQVLPDNIGVVTLVAVVPVVAVYALIEWVSARTEMVPVLIAKKP